MAEIENILEGYEVARIQGNPEMPNATALLRKKINRREMFAVMPVAALALFGLRLPAESPEIAADN